MLINSLLNPTSSAIGTPIRVFVADDHPVVRAGLQAVIAEDKGLECVGSTADSHQLTRQVLDAGAHVVVLDISLPGPGMIACLQELRDVVPEVRTLVLTVHEEFEYVRHAMQAGAAGYVLKRTAARELVTAIREIAAGRTYVDSAYADRNWQRTAPRRSTKGANELSPREEKVLRWIAQGHSNKEIAAQLGISVKSVDTYKMRSMRKLSLKNRADAIQYALLKGWLTQSTAMGEPFGDPVLS